MPPILQSQVRSEENHNVLPASTCAPLPFPEEIALWDRASVNEVGLRSELLMENACREALIVFERELGDPAGLVVLCFAGPGNNGGDAFGLARHLHDRGAQVLVLHTRPEQHYKNAAGYHLALARLANVPLKLLPQGEARFDQNDLFGTFNPDAVVDGLLGTAFTGELKPELKRWIEYINRFGSISNGKGAFVLALDVPSGLNAATGQATAETVRATATATFEAAKFGLVQPGATAYTGRLYIRSIGIPRVVRESYPTRCNLLTPGVVRLAPQNTPTMHKGIAGRVLVVGGSAGLTGAAVLAGLAALRGGAGLVSLACPAALAAEAKAGFPELITLPIGPGNQWRAELVDSLIPHLEMSDAVVLGPGLGRDPGAHAFLATFLTTRRPPTVIDADALYWLGLYPELGLLLGPKDVLTPHPGEMAGLLNKKAPITGCNRLDSTFKLAQERKVVTVLKGAGTIIATPTGTAYLSPFTCPTLAVGGSGDVLAGLIAALLGRNISPLPAACLAVYWHGLCGALLAHSYPHRGNLAREIAQALPQALKELYNANSQGYHDYFTGDCNSENRYWPCRSLAFRAPLQRSTRDR